jgi:VCBS repeat-containing protein
MLRARRWAGISVLSVAVAAGGVAIPAAGASASVGAQTVTAAAATAPASAKTPGAGSAAAKSRPRTVIPGLFFPEPLKYACALKTNGLMSYVAKARDCASNARDIRIAPGPTYVCVHSNKTVHLVAALSDCSLPVGVQSLTLPSTTTVYFCAANTNNVLFYKGHRGRCTLTQFAVEVPVPHVRPALSNIESSTLSYQAGTPAVPITSSLTVSAPSDTNLQWATVKVSSGFVSAEDVLSFSNQNGITGSYNSGTGVLKLTGASSVANYQQALQSVTYNDPNGKSPTTGNRTISFRVYDRRYLKYGSNMVSRTIDVEPNSPPVAGNVNASTDKHTAIDIDVLSSDSDPDLDPLSITAVDTAGTLGSVSINANGTIHYDPNGQFNGLSAGQSATDTFGYTVSDGYHTATATVTVTVTGVNDPPVIANIETSPLSYQAQSPPVQITSALTLSDDDDSTMSGATVAITSGFDSGADTLSFTNTSAITGSYDASTGVLTLSGDDTIGNYQTALQSVEFSTSDNSATPAARTVSFTVTDSVGATSTGTAQRVIDVSQAPQPPTAINQSYTAVGNTALGVGTSPTAPAATVSGSLLNGDTDPNPGGTLTVTTNSSPAHGTVSVNPDGTFTYVPNAGFSGTDTFTYTIADSNHLSETATATVTITVGPVVWYVNNSLSAAGTGVSTSPFNTLAAANSAAGQDSIVFLYQGSADYTGGVAMKSGEALLGQPNGLTEDGYSLVSAGGSAPTITNSGGDGIGLAENADVEGVNVTNPSGNGIAASGVNDATVGASTAVAISGAGGDGIHVSGGSGTLDFAGASVTGSTGHSVLVTGRTGGTTSFGGNITDKSTGISLTSNTGAAIGFSGTLTLDTGANTAFSATGGGTVTASGSGSAATTTTATAVDIENTTIGSGGLVLQSVSSDGASPGILLSNTGTSGGLTVTGTGSAGSGGIIQNSAGEGIMLSSTTAPSFTDMMIENNAADGINGSQVNGLTLAGSTVSGNGTVANAGDTHNDDGLDFTPNTDGSPDGLTGTVSITNSTITGSADDNAIISDTSGILNLTVTGSTFSNTNTNTPNGYGLAVNANGSTSATVSVTASNFTNNADFDFQFETDFGDNTAASGTNSVTFSGNTVNGGGGALIESTGTAATTLTADNNNIQNSNFAGISVGAGFAATDTGTLSGTISGNTVGTPSVANSGGGDGISVGAQSKTTLTLAITNNDLHQFYNLAGINYETEEGSPTMNLTITGNTIADPGEFGSWGILGDAGALTTDGGTVCAAISSNTLTGSGESSSAGVSDFELDQFGATTYELPGYTGGAFDTGAVVSFVQGNNTPGGGSAPTGIATTDQADGGHGFVNTPGGSSCPAPS